MREEKSKKIKIILSDLNKPRKGSIFYNENEIKWQTSLLGNNLVLNSFYIVLPVLYFRHICYMQMN